MFFFSKQFFFNFQVVCTNWKRLLMVLTGRSNTTNVVSIPASLAHNESSHQRLSDIPTSQLPPILSTYTLFVMVRHPFERLLSAYRNKLEDNQASAKYFQSIFGRHIIKHYRNNATQKDLETGDNVTFKEFVRYLITEGVDSASANEHWRSVYSLCRPCDLDYTFIGKYDTFTEDTQAVLDLISAPKLTFPHTRSGKTGDRLRTYFRQLDLDDIKSLYLLYEMDFKLFGYTAENILGYDFG